jgi:hypothetical protein
MSLHVHALARWRIRRLFTAGLAPHRYRDLLDDLHGCAACASLFERQSELESALCSEPSPFALERVETAVLERVAGEPAEARSTRSLVAVASAACAIALIVAFGRPASERAHLGRDMALASVTARGELAPRSANVGIRLLRATSKVVSEPSHLSIGDVVTFTWTDVDPAARYLAILGVQSDGRVRWYYPDEDATSLKLDRALVDEPLGDGIRLAVRHAPGWLRVTALFSPLPLAKAEIEASVRALRQRPGALEELVPLPLTEGVLEHSIRVDIAGGP